MGRPKKQKPTRRKDGRFVIRYDGQWFYSTPWAPDASECFEQKEEYIRMKEQGLLAAAQGPTVRYFAATWLPNYKPDVSRQTYNEAVILMEKLLRHIGDEHFQDVLPSEVKAVYAAEYSGMSDTYIRAGKRLYCALFDAALADGLCKKNVAREKAAAPHRGTVGGHRAITKQEREWIETLCTDHRAHPAVIAMLYAGIRPPEAKALIIDKSVDFEHDEIHLTDFAHKDGPYRYKITDEGKTPKAKRTIPLFPPLKKVLKGKKGRLISSASGKLVTKSAWDCVWESYVFCMETAINGVQERWYGRTKEHKAILARGEQLPEWIEFTVLPYDLRHSFVAWCRDNGVELNTVVKWMGHADAKMVLKIYDEVSDDRSKAEAEKLKLRAFGSQNGSQTASEEPKPIEK